MNPLLNVCVVSHRALFSNFLCNIKHNLSTALYFSNEIHITIRIDNLMTPNVLSGYQHTLGKVRGAGVEWLTKTDHRVDNQLIG